jgi:hypothetical protein
VKLFEYAILYHAKLTKKDEEDGKQAEHKLVKPITTVLARDEREVLIMASREIPQEYTDKLNRVEVAVRPF